MPSGGCHVPCHRGRRPRVRYPKSAEPTVRGIGFTVGAGEVFDFLSPSGAGKSTTQKILTGLLTGHEGRVAVWGRDPTEWGSDYDERIGVSFEPPNLHHKLDPFRRDPKRSTVHRRRAGKPGRHVDDQRPPEAVMPAVPALRTEQLTKRYGRVVALDALDL
ncbi:MAG: ATP-binding cassette domain-containing protein, partial [Pseudonocardia sp.]|nr:ATP-binding cassette domain-containing protein [Pseudonocardia sp.]